jgi:Beta-lactamase associated winged helix domain
MISRMTPIVGTPVSPPPLEARSQLAAEKCVSVAPGVRQRNPGRVARASPRAQEKVLRSLRRLAAATLDELTPLVYDDVAVERHRWARLTLEAHLIKLARECRASERDGLWRPSHP